MKPTRLPTLRGKITSGHHLAREITRAINECEVRALRTSVAQADATRNALVAVFNACLGLLANPTATPALVPDTGPVAGGTSVVITGTNLRGLRSVTVDAVAATIVSVSEDGTSATIRTPAGTAGAKAVVITNLYGSVTKAGAFTYA